MVKPWCSDIIHCHLYKKYILCFLVCTFLYILKKNWNGNAVSDLHWTAKSFFCKITKILDVKDIVTPLFIIERRDFSYLFEIRYRRCEKMECNRTSPYPLLKLLVIVDIKKFKEKDIEQKISYTLNSFKKMDALPLMVLINNYTLELNQKQSEEAFLDILSYRRHSVIFLDWDTNKLLQFALRPGVTEWIMYLDNWASALQLLDDSRVRSIVQGNDLYSTGWILRPSVMHDAQNFLELGFCQTMSKWGYSALYQVAEPNFLCFIHTAEWAYRLRRPDLTFNSLALVFDLISRLENWNICAPFLNRLLFVDFSANT
ncbi:hypothetical protein GpartN1_g3131.t1 [Galdieria partita]|uniref:Uncharacterized protein n=1 Tax=Galdieria partita TaxID=83374 RepID=A0A9C7PVX4_9RHOD|nr:hypothetical protein GpartN1_g3131.t1 [Galdieria partita]